MSEKGENRMKSHYFIEIDVVERTLEGVGPHFAHVFQVYHQNDGWPPEYLSSHDDIIDAEAAIKTHVRRQRARDAARKMAKDFGRHLYNENGNHIERVDK